jgi:hypothetical protein
MTVSHESVRWRIFEALAIVASILLAFAIDAWWEERQERQSCLLPRKY